MLGFYLSSHPLAEHAEDAGRLLLAHHGRGGRAEAPHRGDARRHDLGDQARRTRRTPSPAAPAATPCSTWKTPSGMMRCILWPEQFVQLRRAGPGRRHSGRPRRGRQAARQRGGEPDRQRDSSRWTSSPRATPAASGSASSEEARTAAQKLEQLHEILRGYPGNCELQLLLCLADGRRVAHEEPADARRLSAPRLRDRLDALLGPGNVQIAGRSASVAVPRPAERPATRIGRPLAACHRQASASGPAFPLTWVSRATSLGGFRRPAGRAAFSSRGSGGGCGKSRPQAEFRLGILAGFLDLPSLAN